MRKLAAFFQRNWFKIALAVLLVYITFKKEIRLQMNLQRPMEQPAEAPREVRKPREKFTDFLFGQKAGDALPGAEQLEIQPFRKETAHAELNALAAIPDPMREVFIERFGRVAKAEQEKFGIPASIVLGNALLIGKAGEAMSVKLGLNFFGLTCTEDWLGEKGEIEGRCFRYYESAWMSFRDHSLFITTGKFSSLRSLKGQTYSAWADALEKAGFKPVPDYALQVKTVIRRYGLAQWDAK
jgi:flagellum-specific peptidoglycan hydrolase FlgJ